jgi:hypothetical protein
MKTPQTLLEFMKTPSSFEGMLGGCQYYNTPNFIKNKLLPNHCSDKLIKPPQTFNYDLFKPPQSSQLSDNFMIINR